MLSGVAVCAVCVLAAALPASGGAGLPGTRCTALSMRRRTEFAAGRSEAMDGVLDACSTRLVQRLRGGSDREEEDSSAVKREAAMLADMGFEYIKEGGELEKLDPEGRKYTPAARTIPGELCSDDDLSNPSGQGAYVESYYI